MAVSVEVLNRIMELELAGVVRYTHYSLMVFGYNRIPIVSWLKGNADESLAHAHKAGEFATMLGGHPSLKIGPLLETEKHDIGDICKGEHCHCDEHKGIFVPALTHTLKVFGFLLVFTLALNFAIELLGADRLSEILLGNTFFQPLIAALIGLIPNCAASVLLTEMYLGGALSFASVIAGLCSGAGIGLMVLFRTNKKPRENLKILGLLYGISAFSGVIIEIFTKLMA